MKTFGEILKEKREEKGWTEQRVAKKLGVSPVTIWHWENNDNCPHLLTACDIADLFECSLDELCGRVKQ
jgi:DNA-binding XRE family transcriptional regulator